jgi:PhzF family phenazine biosynthesis protein
MNPTEVPFSIVDVFAQAPLSGNPLAVVADADGLDEDAMRRVAREFNLSETTFVLEPTVEGATWRLRSFTPAGAEVVGAGHNALGAWWWLAETGRIDAGDRPLAQQLGERVLGVEIAFGPDERPTTVVMDQSPARSGAIAPDRWGLAGHLGLSAEDLRDDIPTQVVDTGAAHLLVPAVSADAVDRARPNAEPLLAQLRAIGAQGCYLYALDPRTVGATAYARFFNPTVGIWEDPATGSAAGPLACHLVDHGHAPNGSRVIIEQGHAMGRPSLLQVCVADNRVRLGGACVTVAEGRLIL